MTHKIYYMNFSFLFAKTQKLCNSFYFNIFLHFKIDVKEQMLCIFSDLMHMFIKKIILRYFFFYLCNYRLAFFEIILYKQSFNKID